MNDPLAVKRQEREAQLVRLLEAASEVESSLAWKVLREELFDDLADSLERRILNAAKESKIDEAEIYRLQGQLLWARRYANLSDLQKEFKVELQGIKQRKL